MNWYTNTVPKCEDHKCSEEILVSVFNRQWNIKRVLRAVYIPDHHVTVEDMGWNMWWNMWDGVPEEWQYDEDLDSWWISEGWYEIADNFDEYQYAEISGEVYAWANLPKPYEPKVKDLSKELIK